MVTKDVSSDIIAFLTNARTVCAVQSARKLLLLFSLFIVCFLWTCTAMGKMRKRLCWYLKHIKGIRKLNMQGRCFC